MDKNNSKLLRIPGISSTSGWRTTEPRQIWVLLSEYFQVYLIVELQTVLGKTTNLKKIYREFIFDHDFAQAIWGSERKRTIIERNFDDKKIEEGRGCITSPIAEWQYHLQQMVLCKNPLKYLENG